jgi:hypothetical protein
MRLCVPRYVSIEGAMKGVTGVKHGLNMQLSQGGISRTDQQSFIKRRVISLIHQT